MTHRPAARRPRHRKHIPAPLHLRPPARRRRPPPPLPAAAAPAARAPGRGRQAGGAATPAQPAGRSVHSMRSTCCHAAAQHAPSRHSHHTQARAGSPGPVRRATPACCATYTLRSLQRASQLQWKPASHTCLKRREPAPSAGSGSTSVTTHSPAQCSAAQHAQQRAEQVQQLSIAASKALLTFNGPAANFQSRAAGSVLRTCRAVLRTPHTAILSAAHTCTHAHIHTCERVHEGVHPRHAADPQPVGKVLQVQYQAQYQVQSRGQGGGMPTLFHCPPRGPSHRYHTPLADTSFSSAHPR